MASIDVEKTGYTPLGVIAFRGGSNTIAYNVSAIVIIDKRRVDVVVVNRNNSAETSNQSVEVDVLYRKN